MLVGIIIVNTEYNKQTKSIQTNETIAPIISNQGFVPRY